MGSLFASIVLPGVGQLFQGNPQLAFGFGGTALLGLSLAYNRVDYVPSLFVRERDGQLARYGMPRYQACGFTSAYHAFQQSIPAFQQKDGKYLFVKKQEPLREVLLSPFRFSFLRRPSSFVPLVVLGGLQGVFVSA